MIKSPHLYMANAPKRTPASVLDRVATLDRVQSRAGVSPIYSLGHLGRQTGVAYKSLREMVDRRVDAYTVYSIRKRDGVNFRSIAAPRTDLQDAQRWLLDNVFSHIEVHGSSYAYQRGLGVKDCASRHLGAKWLIRLDLKDFFHQTDESDVYHLARTCGYSELVSFELGRLTTRLPSSPQAWLPQKYAEVETRRGASPIPYGRRRLGYLPQGAPTSGAIANALAMDLDKSLDIEATNLGFVYTRYADDLTLSSMMPFSDRRAQEAISTARRLIARNGYVENSRKTRLVRPGGRLEVLGVLVDSDKLRLPSRTILRIQYHLRGIKKFGIAKHQIHTGFRDPIGMLSHIRGLIDYANDIDPSRAAGLRAQLTEIYEGFGAAT